MLGDVSFDVNLFVLIISMLKFVISGLTTGD